MITVRDSLFVLSTAHSSYAFLADRKMDMIVHPNPAYAYDDEPLGIMDVPDAPYAERLAILREHHIALWDVFAACDRAGSLDTAIRNGVPNDIPGLLKKCPHIRKICCNGQTAGKSLCRFFPELAPLTVILPSTSPAAAGIPPEVKRARWREALQ